MADLQLRILGEDNASSAFSSVASGVRAAQQIIIDFTRQSLKAYAESERVQRQLELVAKGLTGAFQAQATAIAQANAVSDELVQQLQTMLLRYGAVPAAVESTTQAVLDYAAATGTDARTATEALTRGVESGTGHFKGLGITIQATGDRTKDMAAAVAELGKKFGGAAGADAQSLTGQVRGAEEAFGDLQEAFGGFVSQVASKTGALSFLTEELRNVAKGAEIAQRFLATGGLDALKDSALAMVGVGSVGAAKDKLNAASAAAVMPELLSPATSRLQAQAIARGAGRGGRVAGGAGGGAGGATLEGEMLGPQTYAAFLNDPSRPMFGPEAPTGEQSAAMARVQSEALKARVAMHDKAMADIERMGKEMAAKMAAQTQQFAQVGATLGGALASNLTNALEQLMGGGEQDVGQIIANILSGLLTAAGGLLGNLLLPGLGGALGTALGGLAGAGVRAAAGAGGPQVNINTFDARGVREFFEADGGRGLHNAKRTGRGQGW